MAENKDRAGISIGSTMLILIFGVLCLTTFAVLAMVSANADFKLADKSEKMVTAYYEADAKAEELLQEVDENLRLIYAKADNMDDYYGQVAKEYEDAFVTEDKMLHFTQIMNEQIQISMELEVTDPVLEEKFYKVAAWNTEYYGDYKIDTSISVWTGEELN